MAKVVHFEVHAGDPERAIRFYEAVFEWRFKKFPGPAEYWVIEAGPENEVGINGGLVPRRGEIDGSAVIAYVCTIQVPSVDEALARVLAAGGTLALPKMPIPGVGWLLYCKDSEGNVFGVMQPDPQAAP
jgi:predicted enzyme related to lactoylglutathione lyase